MTDQHGVEEGGRDYGAYIPSVIDDYGLDPYEFRVYCRLERRIGRGNATCFESIANMAASCFMSSQKVRDALQVLVLSGIAKQEKIKGKTDRYILMPPAHWVDSSHLDEIRRQVTAYRFDSDAKSAAKHKQLKDTSLRRSEPPAYDVADTSLRRSELPDYDVVDTSLRRSDKGYPIKESHEGIPLTPLTPQGKSKEEEKDKNQKSETRGTPQSVATLSDSFSSAGDEPVDRGEDSYSAVEIQPIRKYTHPTHKCEDRFKNHLHPWQKTRRINDFEERFVEYLRAQHLPTTDFYKSKVVTSGDAKNWINQRQWNEQGLSQVCAKWDDYLVWEKRQLSAERTLEEATARKNKSWSDPGFPMLPRQQHQEWVDEYLASGEEAFRLRHSWYDPWHEEWFRHLERGLPVLWKKLGRN